MISRILQEERPYNVPVDAAYGVLFAVLGTTFLITVAGVLLKGKDAALGDILRPSDDFLSARGKYEWPTLALSFFASGMGAWVIYGAPEMGAIRALSWWGVIGYSTASAAGGWVLCWLGPIVRRKTGGESGFSAVGFALVRYGRLMHLGVTCISCFYMYIYVVAELTTIANVYATFVGKSTEGDDSKVYTTKVAAIVVIFTWSYTCLAGLPASILTDKFQGVTIMAFVIMLLVAALTLKSNEVSKKEFNDATGWFAKGGEAFVTLWIAIISASLFHQGTWQRVFAAKSDRDMRIGFAVGGMMVTVLMMFFGVMGMIAYARDREAYDTYQKLGYLSIFDLLRNLPQFWHYVTLILLTTLAASSVDTLQNGLASVLSHDLLKHKLSPNWSRLVIIGFMIAAVIQAAQRFEVVPLFLAADLVCATSVLPLFLGIWDKDLEFWGGRIVVRAPTEVGALIGCVAGIVAVIVNGKINDVHKAINPYTGKVYEKGPLSYFWGINYKSDGTPYECALCGPKLMVTFIVVPLVAGAATIIFSWLDVWMGGDRAREPFAVIPRLDLPTDPALLKKNKDELELGEIGALIEHDRDTADENKAEN
mmetsp:Transcript_22646/g.67903  ORF Transcript_22646/g.67903 Transcript_22646/m.67903 type:complete len:593 (+) Transcript_22646:246-2024(+)